MLFGLGKKCFTEEWLSKPPRALYFQVQPRNNDDDSEEECVTGEENFQMHRGTSVLIIPARQYLFSTEAAVSVSVRQGV